MFKVKNNIAPEIMKELFAPKTSSYELGPKIWDLVSNEIKESESLNAFKFKIKRWVHEGCPCRIYKIYPG